MKNKPLPSLDLLRSTFSIVDGSLVSRRSGGVAGSMKPNGYRYVSIGNSLYLAHRIIYMMIFGTDPGSAQVDHMDGNRLNNSPQNLRLASNTQNTRNRRGPTKANSGTKVRGIEKRCGRYRARVKVFGRTISAGTHDTLEQAVAAVRAKRTEIFGEYAGFDGYSAVVAE